MSARKRKSPGRRYRVVESFPWIEGGRLGPEGQREGGEAVTYEPGDIVYMEDQDAASKYRNLEAIDDAGRAILEAARAKAKATRTAVADLTPRDVERWTQALDEARRPYGPHEIVQDIAVYRDGSEKVISTEYVPTNPLPGVLYDNNGLPDWWATAARKRRWELEQLEIDLQNSRRKGGHAPKHLTGLQAAVDRLVTENPDATARELWDLIPEGEGDSDPIGSFIVYRDGSKVIQVDDATGRDKPISFRSFCRYVTRARSK